MPVLDILVIFLRLLFPILLVVLEMTQTEKSRILEMSPQDLSRPSNDRLASPVVVWPVPGQYEQGPVIRHYHYHHIFFGRAEEPLPGM
jgi:hypothetical protein